MEAISTSVPSINLPKLHHHFHHLKPPLLHHHISTPTTTTTTTTGKNPTSISTKPTPPSHYKSIPHQLLSTPQPTRSAGLQTHRNAATGYAAALVDAGVCSNSLDLIHKDVKRLLKWVKHNQVLKGMMGDPLVEEGVKGKVIKEVSEKAKLRRQVVAMVKMLVAKNKSGMVVSVMEEFERIYLELNCSLRVVD